MKIDIDALRRDAEEIEDINDRAMALRGLHELENIEFDTDRRRAQLLREFSDNKTYRPQPKFRLGLLAILSFGMAYGMGHLLFRMLESGIYKVRRTGHIFTVDADPTVYWFQVGLYTLIAVVIVLATIGIVMAFIKHPHPPFKWNARKRT